MNERIEEQPYDDRHNTPPASPGFALPTMDERRYPALTKNNNPSQVHGLSFSFDGISSWVDIGRHFPEADALEDMHEVDLRTVLAHLDSAARAITRELETRGLGGRR